jgi:GH15 family glucan-1,4-alpha-glucosidase
MLYMSRPIESYAVIGDLHTVALVSRLGSIDWLCLPHFDSSACFASMLGDQANGHWTIAPTNKIELVTRTYRPESLVLETEMACETGTIRITDFMPIREDTEGQRPEIIRTVEGLEGAVPVRSELCLRFDYGRGKPFIRETKDGIQAVAGPDGVLIASSVDIRIEGHEAVSECVVKAGDSHTYQIMWHPSWEDVPKMSDPVEAREATSTYWRHWSEQCTYEGRDRDAVLRSLITLKSLTYRPSGGIVAAPTTSLPEEIGGERNWDYRYTWLRDSSVTLAALNRCGFSDEARAFRNWLIRAVAGDPSEMQIMYGISGERRLVEMELPWLAGYMDSSPVRIGNAASGQFQLDVYGELLGSQQYSRETGVEASEEAWELQVKLAEFVEQHWQDPDDGIWEVRGGRKQFTHSKVMAWVAADSIRKGIVEYGLPGDAARWKKLADEIKADVLEKAIDPDLNCFTQSYGSKSMDASLLVICLVRFLPPDDERIINTVREVEKQLTRNGLVLRYLQTDTDDGLSGDEGTFIMCSFWLVQCLAVIGDLVKARMLFDRLLDVRNDVGLMSEEYDTVHHRMLGNTPQAFSHVGLINAALYLRDLDAEGSLENK